MSCQNPFHNENLTEAIDNSDLSPCKVAVTLDRPFTQCSRVLLPRISIITFRLSVTELSPHRVEPSKYPPTAFKIVAYVIPITPSNSSVLCNFRIMRLVLVKSVMSLTNPQANNNPFWPFTTVYSIHSITKSHLHPLWCCVLDRSPTHSTTRVTTYTWYCCHNTGIDLQDFKFSAF